MPEGTRSCLTGTALSREGVTLPRGVRKSRRRSGMLHGRIAVPPRTLPHRQRRGNDGPVFGGERGPLGRYPTGHPRSAARLPDRRCQRYPIMKPEPLFACHLGFWANLSPRFWLHPNLGRGCSASALDISRFFARPGSARAGCTPHALSWPRHRLPTARPRN